MIFTSSFLILLVLCRSAFRSTLKYNQEDACEMSSGDRSTIISISFTYDEFREYAYSSLTYTQAVVLEEAASFLYAWGVRWSNILLQKVGRECW